MSMDDIMRASPGTIHVVLKHRMLCVGCPIAPFHTMSDACREHSVDEPLFVDHIKCEIGSKNEPP
ncbi:DUF1858 domain-containing protein [Aminobacter carboxidus]